MRTHFFRAAGVLLVSACLSANAFADVDLRWLIRGQKVYVSPDTAPLTNGWVLMNRGTIEAVGSSEPKPPASPKITGSACDGGVILAGFQNSHVHFTDASFNDAGKQPVAQLN